MSNNEGHDELDQGQGDELDEPEGLPRTLAGTRADGDDGDEPGDEDTARDEDGAVVYRQAYVSQLRGEAAAHRANARVAKALAEERAAALWTARVAALGVLADPADLDYNPDALDDPGAIAAAADELLTRKPHLRTRAIRRRAGQGEGGNDEGTVSLSQMLRRGA